MRLLFWGTPDFAVPALRALLGEGHDVVGVVTQPDKPRGRSRSQLDPSPVKVVALEEGLPVLQPEKPRGEEFMAAMRELNADISVVVAYGHILPRAVIELPKLGTINIHGSLLPALRGAAPIQAAILGGFTETGITIMQMVPALDAGPMLHVVKTNIEPDETYGELHDRMAELGALAIVQGLALIETGISHAVPQDDSQATFAPKVSRELGRIDWTKPAEIVSRLIRAYDPRPGAFTMQNNLAVKCFGAELLGDGSDEGLDDALLASEPGTVRDISAAGAVVRCGTGAIRVKELQPAGKPRLAPLALSRGRGLAVGHCFDELN
ncbi:MAG: methionyl-tRNA formyltransferase [Gemmatimonadaceae bacterium]